MNINEWVKLVGKYVPSRKERAAVQAELMDHYADRYQAFRSTGMSFEEASKQALAAMGDPDDTGRLLRRVHKPWLTWGLRLMRVGLILLVLIALGFFGTIKDALQERIENRRLKDPTYIHTDFSYLYQSEKTTCAFRRGTMEGSGSFGSYPITAEKAWTRWTRYRNTESWVGPVGTMFYEKDCVIFLQIQVPFWIDPDLQIIQKYMTVTNSRGESLSYYCQKANQTAAACTFYVRTFLLGDTDELRLRCDTKNISFDFRVRFGEWEDVDGWFSQPAPEDEAALLERLGPPYIDQYNYDNGYSFTGIYDSLCESEPVHTQTLEISVPWAELQTVERRPENEESEEGPFRFSTVDFILKLQGPWEELFLTDYDVDNRLTFTDSHGNKADCFYAVSNFTYIQDAPMVFKDRGFYRFRAEILDDGARAEWYELTLCLDDGPVTLRLTPTEGG